jgi:hypothetical protein
MLGNASTRLPPHYLFVLSLSDCDIPTGRDSIPNTNPQDLSDLQLHLAADAFIATERPRVWNRLARLTISSNAAPTLQFGEAQTEYKRTNLIMAVMLKLNPQSAIGNV